ncbi:MAG: glutaconyl-CoA/methylmalonyl-CoA decarboxylase subunit delta [Thermotoga sp.]|jgi:hypothetical protein|nr:glutaconyl-CoA/methylmalonyl-CoA decarboxylase subunit delta [Thermotoga sp.]MDK2950293.1 glutaconyl-CoA/methylmalonyl-CoA decarboxylase subunit delta [Thermotoga sp.]
MVQIFVFGITAVFLVFLILFFFSVLLRYFSKRDRPAVVEERPRGVEEEVVAVISAVIAQVLEGEYRIVSIKRKTNERGFEVWKKSGWRRRRWSENSGWW